MIRLFEEQSQILQGGIRKKRRKKKHTVGSQERPSSL